jgi:hypothetical protein
MKKQKLCGSCDGDMNEGIYMIAKRGLLAEFVCRKCFDGYYAQLNKEEM